MKTSGDVNSVRKAPPIVPAFLLRDKIKLFDRFALDTSARGGPLTARSVRDDQIDDVVASNATMFPGWKTVPMPTPVYTVQAEETAASLPTWKPTSAKVPMMSLATVNTPSSAVAPDVLPPITVPIASQAIGGNSVDLRLPGLQGIEESLQVLMESALEANTHLLTVKFQSVLKQQFNVVEHRHKALAEQYKSRVTVAMLNAQDKLDRLRTQLSSSRKWLRTLDRVTEERDELAAQVAACKEQLAVQAAAAVEENAKLFAKIKFLRVLAAQRAAVPPSASLIAPSPKSPHRASPAPSLEPTGSPQTKTSIKPKAADKGKSTIKAEEPNPTAVVATKKHIPTVPVASPGTKGAATKTAALKVPSKTNSTTTAVTAGDKPVVDVSREASPALVDVRVSDTDATANALALEAIAKAEAKSAEDNTQFIIELEQKEEIIQGLTRRLQVCERREAIVSAAAADQKQELERQLVLFATTKDSMAREVAVAEASLRDFMMRYNAMEKRVEVLSEREHKATETMEKTVRDLDELRVVKARREEELSEKLGRVEKDLKRSRRAMCARSLLFQAHLKQMGRSVAICDKIDEYLNTQLTCKQCFNLLRKPEVLFPCGHSICQSCVADLKDPETGRITCNDCGGACESITVSNTVIDAILAQYHWWKVSLGDLRVKIASANSSLVVGQAAATESVAYAMAISSTANETNPLMRKSYVAINTQFKTPSAATSSSLVSVPETDDNMSAGNSLL